MLDPQLLATLRSLPLFAGMPDHQVEQIARVTRVFRCEPGTIVFRQWDIARGFYMLLAGSGQLVQEAKDGGRRLLANVMPGQYFNEAALTQELVEQASFVTTAPSLVLHIARVDYTRLPPAAVQPLVPAAPAAQPTVPHTAVPAADRPVAPRTAVPAGSRRSGSAYARQAGGVGRQQPASPQRIPPDYRPKWLNPGETILLMTRRHWWVIVRNLILPAIVFALMTAGVLLAQAAFLRLALAGAAVLICGGWAVYVVFDWRNDWLVITDERVLRVEQMVARFSIQTQEVGLLSVQSITANLRPGDAVSRILRYGDVRINTAGAAGNISMDFVPNPGRIKDYVFRQREIKMRMEGRTDAPGARSGEMEDPEAFPGDSDGRRPSPAVSGGGIFSMRYINARGEMVYRRHLVVWARKIFLPLVALAIGFFVLIFGPSIAALANLGAAAVVGALIGIGVALIWLYLADWDWRHDLYIIGDNVLTLVYRSPLLLQFREDQVLIQRIHNIEAETTGLLRSLLDYGDVRVLLLGDEAPKVFRDVPNPVAVREEISRRQRLASEAARQAEEQRQVDALMARMQAQGLAPAADPALPNPSGVLPPASMTQPGQHPPPANNPPPPQPQRPPIPRRRV